MENLIEGFKPMQLKSCVHTSSTHDLAFLDLYCTPLHLWDNLSLACGGKDAKWRWRWYTSKVEIFQCMDSDEQLSSVRDASDVRHLEYLASLHRSGFLWVKRYGETQILIPKVLTKIKSIIPRFSPQRLLLITMFFGIPTWRAKHFVWVHRRETGSLSLEGKPRARI